METTIKHKDYRFWCDDMRTPKSNDWTVCRSVESFLTKIKRTPIEVLCEKFTLALDDCGGNTKDGWLKPNFRLILNWCVENNIYPKNIYLLSPDYNFQEKVLAFTTPLEEKNIWVTVYKPFVLPFYFNPVNESTNKIFVEDFNEAKKIESKYKYFAECGFYNNDTKFRLRKILSFADCAGILDLVKYYYRTVDSDFYSSYGRINVYMDLENTFELHSHLRALKYLVALTESQYNEVYEFLAQTEVSKEDITEKLKEYFSNIKK